jgi:acyl carrier protein
MAGMKHGAPDVRHRTVAQAGLALNDDQRGDAHSARRNSGTDASRERALPLSAHGDVIVKTVLRRVVRESARLDVPIEAVADDTDLYRFGLTWLATVYVMRAVEEAFEIEIPDSMLTRELCRSIDSLAAAVSKLSCTRAAA